MSQVKLGDKNIPFIHQGNELLYPNPVKNGLVLYYDFKGMKNSDVTKAITKDLSGNTTQNLGFLKGFLYTSQSGYANKGLKFDGIDDKITVYGYNGRFMLDNLTVEWTGKINVSENNKIRHIINCGYYKGWSLTYHDSNQLMLCIKNSLKEDGWSRTYLSRNVFEVGSEPFHFTAVFSPNGIKCYINGDYKEDGSISTEIQPQYEEMFDIAIMNNLEGSLMSTRIYNRELTEEEIKHNYQLEKERWGL
ncbi:hypothetical protein QI353_11550 [Staphylococcus saprophyticus]|nr:hypothetical protein [Staphylococcus saprophyticus]